MTERSDPRKRRLPIVAASEIDSVALDRPTARRLLGGSGTSLALHIVVLLVLSLIAMSQRETFEPLQTEARFVELPGVEDGVVELLDPEIIEQKSTMPNPDVASSLTMPSLGAADSEKSIDLSSFVPGDGEASGAGLPTGIAAIASGIQGRVANAGGRKGEVQFSLAWHSLNDVDLHVIAPSGERIWYSQRTSQCRGELDVDMNASSLLSPENKTVSEEPVENVRWLSRTAPTGRFTIIVHQYAWRNGRTDDDFQLLANLGERTELVQGRVTVERPISVHRFQYVGSSLSKARAEKRAAELQSLQKREDAEAAQMFERAMLRRRIGNVREF